MKRVAIFVVLNDFRKHANSRLDLILLYLHWGYNADLCVVSLDLDRRLVMIVPIRLSAIRRHALLLFLL